MDLRASKKEQFDAFLGNPLLKQPLSKTSYSRQPMNGSDKYNFDELWRGSVSNLMSSENLTEDLIKESINELEKAMQESKRMLHERDNEIQKLRETIDKQNKAKEKDEDEKYPNILNEYKESQKRVLDLEYEIRELNLIHKKEIAILNSSSTLKELPMCGSNCQSLIELDAMKKALEVAKTKYDNLKRKVREFRKQIDIEQREEEERYHEENKTTACTIQ